MKLIAPLYYKDFKCIADACTHSCCVGWRISIDDESLEKYNSLEGEYAKRVKESVLWDEDGPYIAHGECEGCAHLDSRGLCNIYIHYGENFLSEICREHPRYYNRIGDSIAVGVGASCPVAAELILSGELSVKSESVGEVDSDLSEGYPIASILARLTNVIEESESTEGLYHAVLNEAGASPDALDISAYYEVFSSLDYLYPENRERILSALKRAPSDDPGAAKRILSYFLFRHFPDSECELDAAAITVFALISTKILLSMSEDISARDALVAYSEEIEYSTDNKDRIIEEISFNLI